ncbi:LysR family transcriptional regulator [Flavobacterium pectinovorum]|uniref:LysR family transcriptional regulator n=1 Tax=Flavobacterium pectinovorum TaxID=29533 RepID=UPI000AEF10AB|nr:LysR family transcriptional regulator [Flavobacterium pectinovorum]
MEIRHLRLIKAIVEEGSITKAIEKLHLTQSALSHQLKEAEYQLGTPIFLE